MDMHGVSVLLYGDPMTGKTTLASQFPKPAVLSLDGNARWARNDNGELSFTPDSIYPVSSLDELSEQFAKILKEGDKYETLIIDTIDILDNLVRYKVLEDGGIEDESEANDFGRTWRLIREGFKKLIQQMTLKFKGSVVLLSWEDEYTFKDELKNEKVGYRPRFNYKVLPDITGLMTVTARTKKLESKKGVRYAISIGDEANEIGGTRIPIEKTLIEASYENFINNFKA